MLRAIIKWQRLQPIQKLGQASHRLSASSGWRRALACLRRRSSRKNCRAGDLDLAPSSRRWCRLSDERRGEFSPRFVAHSRSWRCRSRRGPLVAGDEERQQPAEVFAAHRDKAIGGRDHRGEPTLHVHRAAPVETAVDDRGRERRIAPLSSGPVAPNRHACEREVALAASNRREEILDRFAAGVREGRTIDGETGRRKIGSRTSSAATAAGVTVAPVQDRRRCTRGRYACHAGTGRSRRQSVRPRRPRQDADPDSEGEIDSGMKSANARKPL